VKKIILLLWLNKYSVISYNVLSILAQDFSIHAVLIWQLVNTQSFVMISCVESFNALH